MSEREEELLEELGAIEHGTAHVVPILEHHVRTLRQFCDKMVEGAIVAEDNHFGFMALNFHAKQLHHVEAILLLQTHADTALIARSMLEGLCLLKWAAAEDPRRPLAWRSFSLVIDWRLAMERLEAGDSTMLDEIRELAERIAARGDDLLNSKAIDARERGLQGPSDPYVKTWYKPQLRQIFEAVGAEALYEDPYYHMSEWHHWSPGGLAQKMRFREQTMSFAPRSRMIQAASLANAFQCLLETAQLVNEKLDLGKEDALDQLIVDYVADAQATGGPENAHASRPAV